MFTVQRYGSQRIRYRGRRFFQQRGRFGYVFFAVSYQTSADKFRPLDIFQIFLAYVKGELSIYILVHIVCGFFYIIREVDELVTYKAN